MHAAGQAATATGGNSTEPSNITTMARPTKSNADYFRHDNDMRNDPKIKALRGKFGLEGYAIWNMILETLTDADGFMVDWNALSIELFAGDFGVCSDRLEEIVFYMVKIGLVQIQCEKLECKNLMFRMQSVVEKREKMQERYLNRVSAAETTHKIREEKIREDINTEDEASARKAEIESVISALKADQQKKSPPNSAPPPQPQRTIAQIVVDNPGVRNTYEGPRRLPPERFEQMVKDFDTEMKAINSHHNSESDLIKHFLAYAANKIRIEKDSAARAGPDRKHRSTITRAGGDPMHYRKPQSF